MVVVTSLLSSELEQYRNGGMETAWARTPMPSISASRVRGSYWERARGSGVFLPTPLTAGSSRTTPSPIPDRSARPSRASHSSNPIGIAWLCTSIAVARTSAASARWPSLDSFASIYFLRVLSGRPPCWPLRVRRSHAFLLDGTFPSCPTVASWPHATLRSSGCPERDRGGRNGSDDELQPGCRGGRRAHQTDKRPRAGVEQG